MWHRVSDKLGRELCVRLCSFGSGFNACRFLTIRERRSAVFFLLGDLSLLYFMCAKEFFFLFTVLDPLMVHTLCLLVGTYLEQRSDSFPYH